MHSITDKRLLCLRPQDINVPMYRTRKCFDEYEMRLLIESIRVNGIIQPLSVRKNENGCYELIAGERRLKAAICAGLRRVPCVLHKADDCTAAIFAVIENLQRTDLTVFETAEGISKLINEYGISQTEVGVRLGLAQSTVSNKLRLLRLEPRIRRKITAAELSERHARALLRLPQHKQMAVLDLIIAEGFSIKQTEDYIEEILNPLPKANVEKKETTVTEKTPEKQQCKAVIGDMRLFTNSLTKLIDTLKNAGIKAQTRKYETAKYIEYKVRIKKEEPYSVDTATQLKIC